MNLKQFRLQKGIKAKELAEAIETDEPMISKFENFKCLPTPDKMKGICEVLKCSIDDIYEKNEYTFVAKKKKRTTEEAGFYKLTVKLNTTDKELFDGEFLRMCGYTCLKDLIERRVIRHLKKKKECFRNGNSKTFGANR